MISALRQHQTISRLALLAAVLLFSWQTINASHIHADELEASCVVCATGQHDDDAVLESSHECPHVQPAVIFQSKSNPSSSSARTYRPSPRAPPAS